MLLSLFITWSIAISVHASPSEIGCQSIKLPDNSFSVYVSCKGNFSEMNDLKRNLKNISDPITVFQLEDAFLDVLPPDIFHDVPKPVVRKLIFSNVSIELLEVPELGDPPLDSIKDTVEIFEIYDSTTVFAWDFASLSFDKLIKFIIEDSDLISITVPFFFWPDLQFIQFQNTSLKWINPVAFQGNKELVICSLAHNKISTISRSMFPKPASKLYSLDFSFNKLKFLPDDMFTGMDMLHELKLDGNQLSFFSAELINPVWNNLTQLWLSDNKIRCEPLCWMAGEAKIPIFLDSSKCKQLSGKLFFIPMYLEEKCHRRFG